MESPPPRRWPRRLRSRPKDDKLKDSQMEVADKPEKVVLPTNESSESLIKIRHTVFIEISFFLDWIYDCVMIN